MDSKERHELEENDLASFITHFGEWWAKHGNTVLIVFIIVALSVGGYRFITGQRSASHQAAWSDLAGTTTPQGYQLVAQSHADLAVQSLALLRGADLLLGEAVQGKSPDDETLAPGEALTQAASMYKQVAQSKAAPAYRVNALLGLAAVHESQQQWQQAQEAYNQADELASSASLTDLASQAQARLALLPEIEPPVIFAEPAATQPAVEQEAATDASATSDDDQPAADQPAASE